MLPWDCDCDVDAFARKHTARSYTVLLKVHVYIFQNKRRDNGSDPGIRSVVWIGLDSIPPSTPNFLLFAINRERAYQTALPTPSVTGAKQTSAVDIPISASLATGHRLSQKDVLLF